ncbi:tyrosine-type recombinase/integrase [Chloroflexota bacterium]
MQKLSVDHLTSGNLIVTTNLKSLAQGYLLNCRCEGKASTTIAYYEGILRRFLLFYYFHEFPDNPQKMTPFHIRQFLWYVASEPVRWNASSSSALKPASPSTVNHYYRALNTFFSWLQSEGFITDNPVAHIKTPKVEQKVIQALASRDVQTLLNLLSSRTFLDSRNRAIVMILLDTGMRVSELASLRLSDLDMNTGSILIRRGKGGKQRVVRIGATVQKTVWRYLTLYHRSNSDRLFLTKSHQPLEVTGIKQSYALCLGTEGKSTKSPPAKQ